MDLEEVDVFDIETGQGGIDLVEDCLSGESCCISAMYLRVRPFSALCLPGPLLLTIQSPVQHNSMKRGKPTTLIDIILASPDLLWEEEPSNLRNLAHGTIALRQDDQLMSRDIVLLDRLANDNLRCAVAVYIRRIPGIKASVVGCFEEGKRLSADCQHAFGLRKFDDEGKV